MFARFDENSAMILQDIKETKCYRRTHAQTDGQRENSIPTTNKVCGGYKDIKETKRYRWTHNLKTVYPPQTKFVGGIIKFWTGIQQKIRCGMVLVGMDS